MRRFRIKMLAFALAAIVLCITAQGSLAYYSTVGIAANVVASGDSNLKLTDNR